MNLSDSWIDFSHATETIKDVSYFFFLQVLTGKETDYILQVLLRMSFKEIFFSPYRDELRYGQFNNYTRKSHYHTLISYKE